MVVVVMVKNRSAAFAALPIVEGLLQLQSSRTAYATFRNKLDVWIQT